MVLTWLSSHPLLLLALSVPVLYAVGVCLGRWLRRGQGVSLGVIYQLGCVAFACWLPLYLHGRIFGGWLPENDTSFQHFSAVTAVLGILLLIALIRRYYWELWWERVHRSPSPKFLAQLGGLVAFIIGVLAVFAVVYRVNNVAGLLAGSTVVAAILGFALQDLLGNIIAGIALEIGKPFKPGDWLTVDGQFLEVIEVNWRSTRLRNNDDITLDIPNKNIVGSTITNLTFPTKQHALRLRCGFDYKVSPNLIKDCLVQAALHAKGVLQTPEPRAFVVDFGDSAVVYEVKFWIDDQRMFNEIVDAIRTNIWYEAQRHNIRIPFPTRTLHIERDHARAGESLTVAKGSVRKQPILQLLEPEQLDRLLAGFHIQRYGRGERIIEQGTPGHSMFILLEGEADVLVHTDGPDACVATLRSSDYFGEMSLLTGEPRSATVVATRDCELWEIRKEALAEILQENQAVVQRLSELMARRLMNSEGILASTNAPAQLANKQKEYTETFLKRLYTFFEL